MKPGSSPATLTVAIWHNATCSFRPWEPGDPMIKVFAYEVPARDAREPFLLLEAAFETFNISAGELAQAYRARDLRSLSVGDVVAIGELAWACDRSGWRQLSGGLTVTTEAVPGSIPLE